MRVSFFLASLRGGGAERSVVNLCDYFIDQGYDVDLVLVDYVGQYISILNKKVNIFNFSKRRSFHSIFSLRKYILKRQPDILMSSVINLNLILIFTKLIIFNKIKTKIFLNQVNHMTSAMSKSQNNLTYFEKFKFKTITLLYSFSDGLISMSQGVMEDMKSYGMLKNSNLTYIYNPIYRDNLIPVENALPHFTKPTFISVGRLEYQKNFFFLLKAFAKVREKINCQLIILGQGSEESDLKKYSRSLNIMDDVNFLGFVENPYSYMQRADTFVLSSRWEGFGNVIVEALACGIQIVSTNCNSGPSEILDNGKYGFLAEVDEVEKFSDLMITSLDSKIEKKLLINRAKTFSIDKIGRKYEDFFSSKLT